MLKMFHYSIFVILISNALLSSGIEDYIIKWRNEVGGNVQYIRGSEIGITNKKYDLGVTTEKMINCMIDKRENPTQVLVLKEAFQLFGLCVCYFINDGFSKCDATVDYENVERLRYYHYQKFAITQEKGSIKFFDQANMPEKSENVFVKTVTNRSSKDVITGVSITFEKEETAATFGSDEIGAGFESKFVFDVGFYSTTVEIKGSYSYLSSSKEEEGKTSTFTVEETFTIPPQSSKRIVCSVQRKDFDLVWEIPLIITGAVAINLNKDIKDGDWIFVDVKYVAKYFKELSLTRGNPPKLKGFIRGRTVGSHHFHAEAISHPSDMNLSPVQESACNALPSSVKK